MQICWFTTVYQPYLSSTSNYLKIFLQFISCIVEWSGTVRLVTSSSTLCNGQPENDFTLFDYLPAAKHYKNLWPIRILYFYSFFFVYIVIKNYIYHMGAIDFGLWLKYCLYIYLFPKVLMMTWMMIWCSLWGPTIIGSVKS